ncbi:Oplophorus-luciferin 2-monooxygenase non-catalytic subunit-like 8, partial [Homarus americanus]
MSPLPLYALLCVLAVSSCCVGRAQGKAVVDDVTEKEKLGQEREEFSDREREYNDYTTLNRPCPDEDVIAPCRCIVIHGDDYSMVIDCSDVESEDQLAKIMSSSFPFNTFNTFHISKNNNLKVLRRGSLGNATFQRFFITYSSLEVIETEALAGSYKTVTEMTFEHNEIEEFPWGELSSFTNLKILSLYDNVILSFPPLISDTLERLYLSHNPFGSVPVSAFKGAPALIMIDLNSIEMPDIVPGTYSDLPALEGLWLGYNQLHHVPEGALEIVSTSTSVHLNLVNNSISSVAVNAFSGLTSNTTITLRSNQLQFVEEEVWRPLLEKGVVSLDLEGTVSARWWCSDIMMVTVVA